VKFVVVVLAILLLVWLLLGSSRRRAKEARREPSPKSAAEGMVTCAHCGVHLPGSLALQSRGLTYCSVAHRDAGPSATS
jgi:uncharacterized protein